MLKLVLDQETEAYLVDILAKETTTSDELLKRLIYQHWLSLQPRKPLTEKPSEPPKHLPQDGFLDPSQQENSERAIATKPRRRVPLGSPIFPDRPRVSPEEIARRKAENEAFDRRCEEIFQRVYPELVVEHYDWYIHIEPNSGDCFIDPNEEVSFQKARQKHPNAKLIAMRLNETGTCGRI
jgi:hypothetical protein